jgi:hypothetical protein
MKKAIHVAVMPIRFDGKKWHYKTDRREVTVMCVSGNYAMVRRKGCYPYIAPIKEIEEAK